MIEMRHLLYNFPAHLPKKELPTTRPLRLSVDLAEEPIGLSVFLATERCVKQGLVRTMQKP
ncbi:hypothetical protein AO386_25785 [Pseudomonas syringae ICMP 11292]|nr:hypothetical protein AO386_25785 [Pseudomonas syringae ICMP 11292]